MLLVFLIEIWRFLFALFVDVDEEIKPVTENEAKYEQIDPNDNELNFNDYGDVSNIGLNFKQQDKERTLYLFVTRRWKRWRKW